MTEKKLVRLYKALRELRIDMGLATKFLESKGYFNLSPFSKLDNLAYHELIEEFSANEDASQMKRLQEVVNESFDIN
jgi:hypothetical protein